MLFLKYTKRSPVLNPAILIRMVMLIFLWGQGQLLFNMAKFPPHHFCKMMERDISKMLPIHWQQVWQT